MTLAFKSLSPELEILFISLRLVYRGCQLVKFIPSALPIFNHHKRSNAFVSETSTELKCFNEKHYIFQTFVSASWVVSCSLHRDYQAHAELSNTKTMGSQYSSMRLTFWVRRSAFREFNQLAGHLTFQRWKTS